MPAATPFKVIIAGGGPAAIEAVLVLRDLAPDIHVELLAADGEFLYRPLSVVEPFARPGVRRYPLSDLASDTTTVHRTSIARVDPAAKHVVVSSGHVHAYDALLMATGATSRRALEHALTFGGPRGAEQMHGIIQDLEGGYLKRLTFVAPDGATWTLPLYELALQTAERAHEMCLTDTTVTVVSHEATPLQIFGESVSAHVKQLLDEREIRFVGGGTIPASDRIIALPVPAGRRTPGLPADHAGFLPVDGCGRVLGADGVWGAGDGTDQPIKQGGLAAQMADVAVRSIVATTGRPVEAFELSPVLRALLIAGRRAWYLRRRLDGHDFGHVSDRPLWWPPTKIAGQYLAPYLDHADFVTQQPTLERDMEARRRIDDPPPVPADRIAPPP